MNFSSRVLGLVVVGLLAVGCAAESGDVEGTNEANATAEEAITVANFVKHPRIVEVRNIVQATDGDATLKQEERSGIECTDGPGEMRRRRWVDASGKLKKIQTEWGTDHTIGLTAYYYDDKGALRFVFEKSNSSLGSDNDEFLVRNEDETRVYLNGAGQVFWQVEKHVGKEGQGPMPDISKAPHEKSEFTFEASDPDLEKDPAKAWSNPAVCF